MSAPPASLWTARAYALLLPGFVYLSTGGNAAAQSEFHSAVITRVAVDDANRILVTASEDKTVRIWSLPTGRLLRTIAAPSQPSDHGEILALAISPDGTRVAFSGYTGQKNKRVVGERTEFDYEIYIHDARTGRRLQTLNTGAIIDHLSYSKSGELLLATASELPVLRREELKSYSSDALQVWKASDYLRSGELLPVYAAVAGFDRQGRLVTIARPGGHFIISVYDRDFEELESRDFGGSPAQLSISPDGSMFAVSTLYSSLQVHLTADLSLLYEQNLRDGSDSDSPEYSAIAWSMDGRSLYFAGPGTCSKKGCAIRKWEVGNWESQRDIVVSSHRVTHLAPLKSGGVAFGTAGPSFGTVNASERRVLYRERPKSPATQITRPIQSRGEPDESQCHDPRNNPFVTGRLEYVPGKHVYIDKSGTVVMAPPFSQLWPFSGGLAKVRQGEKLGYINQSGRLAIPARFDEALDFSEDRAVVRIGDRVGYIDETGKLVVPPRYSKADSFSGGLARVVEQGSEYYGYINKAGQIVVPPKFTSADAFHDGLAAVQLHQKWGYINSSGEWVIKPRFDSASRFSEGLASVRNEPCASSNCTHNLIDTSGVVVVQEMLPPSGDGWLSQSLALFRDRLYRYGFVDRSGRTAIPAGFRREVRCCLEGLAAVRRRPHGVTSTGRQFCVVPVQYEQTSPFSEGRGAFLQDGRWGYVDTTGRAIIAPKLHEVSRFSEGLAGPCASPSIHSLRFHCRRRSLRRQGGVPANVWRIETICRPLSHASSD